VFRLWAVSSEPGSHGSWWQSGSCGEEAGAGDGVGSRVGILSFLYPNLARKLAFGGFWGLLQMAVWETIQAEVLPRCRGAAAELLPSPSGAEWRRVRRVLLRGCCCRRVAPSGAGWRRVAQCGAVCTVCCCGVAAAAEWRRGAPCGAEWRRVAPSGAVWRRVVPSGAVCAVWRRQVAPCGAAEGRRRVLVQHLSVRGR
jgi:hypothetical protein